MRHEREYLSTDAMRCRQAIAAYHVQWCRRILEVGGGVNPITDYLLRAPESIVVVDPEIEPRQADAWCGRPCRIDHLPVGIEALLDRDAYRWVPPADGLVMLGFLGFRHLDRDAVMEHVHTADVIAVEAARHHEPAQAGIVELLALRAFYATTHLTIEVRGAGVPADLRFRQRELYVLHREAGR